MKYPQRGQIILHFWDTSRAEQTGQNWLGNSLVGGGSTGVTGLGDSSVIMAIPSIVVFGHESSQSLVRTGERGFIGKKYDAKMLGSRRLAEARAVDDQHVLFQQQLLRELFVAFRNIDFGKGVKR